MTTRRSATVAVMACVVAGCGGGGGGGGSAGGGLPCDATKSETRARLGPPSDVQVETGPGGETVEAWAHEAASPPRIALFGWGGQIQGCRNLEAVVQGPTDPSTATLFVARSNVPEVETGQSYRLVGDRFVLVPPITAVSPSPISSPAPSAGPVTPVPVRPPAAALTVPPAPVAPAPTVPAPTPAPSPAPAPIAVPPGQAATATVRRRAVIRALTLRYERVFTRDTTDAERGDAVTAIQGAASGTALAPSIVLARFEGRETMSETRLAIDTGWTEDMLVFNGTVRLGLAVPSAGVPLREDTLTSPQWAMPADVPLDAKLVEWTSTTGRAMDLFVGSVPGQPEWMRVCWHVRTPEIRQVACTRHLRSDGTLVGADAIHDIGGALRPHATEEFVNERPRRVLRCDTVTTDRGVAAASRSYEVFQFVPPTLIRRWGAATVDFTPGRSGVASQPLGDGAVAYTLQVDPGGTRTVRAEVRDGAVRSYAETAPNAGAGGAVGSIRTTCVQ